MKQFIKSIIYTVLAPFLIRRGARGAIYITFDDGPNVNTLDIIKVLRQKNLKATFFMVGSEMERHPDIVRALINEGHCLAYHSYTHISLKKMSITEVIADFKQAFTLEKEFSIKFKLYRPPYGDLTLFSVLCLIFFRWKIIMWSLDSGDSFYTRDEVLKIVSPENIRDGEILLFHDDYELTADILPVVLQRISEKNIIFRSL